MINYIYIGIALLVGFLLAWILRSISIVKIKKANKSIQGYLESETLKKETLQKENIHAYQSKQAVENEMTKKLEQATRLIKRLDEDILLLQKSNEETEALLQAGEPAIHALKLKLIEANNTISRLKAEKDRLPG